MRSILHSPARQGPALLTLALALAACGGSQAAAIATPTAQPINQATVHAIRVKTNVALRADPFPPNHPPISKDPRGAKLNIQADLQQGCYGPDCIPALDHPRFESVASAGSWLHAGDVVFTISLRGVHRAYPQRILNWHEIVNDTIKDEPIAVTFCPLCGSALAFERKVDGRTVTFGVSGLLFNSDLVMYDRREGSLWQQFSGQAIVGPAARRNEILKLVPIGTTSWGQWVRRYPHAQVLSRDTGYIRDYNVYPYGAYEQDNELYFGIKHTDTRLPLKTVVYGVELHGQSKAYPERLIALHRHIADRVGGDAIMIDEEPSGEVQATDVTAGQAIHPLRSFWFAWATFHPGTQIFRR